MHPEVVSAEPDHSPQCGMKLVAVEAPDTTYTCPMHSDVVREEPGHCPERGMKLLPGNTNREIAQQLFLSLRTVETHLAHAYQKLGISSRGELEGALGRG